MRRLIAIAAVLAVTAPHAIAGPICDAFGAAAPFGHVVAGAVRSKAGFVPADNCAYGSLLYDPICAGKVKLQLGEVLGPDPSDGAPSITATASKGVAVGFYQSRGPEPCGYNATESGIVTGGGAVRGVDGVTQQTIDTSGQHPAVALCRQAIADARTASANLAAMPAALDLGDVVVKLGEARNLVVPGNAATTIRSLRLEGTPANVDKKDQIGPCIAGPSSTLYVTADPPGDIILNVGALSVGNCANLVAYDAVINLAGPGPRINVGMMSEVDPDILAPDRNLTVNGSIVDYPTEISRTLVKNLYILGYVEHQSGSVFCDP